MVTSINKPISKSAGRAHKSRVKQPIAGTPLPSSTRYTLVLDERANQTVDLLQEQFGLRSKAAVFDLAITLLSWASKEIQIGNKVGKVTANSTAFQEVHFLTPKGLMS
jgi:hypothetical protein